MKEPNVQQLSKALIAELARQGCKVFESSENGVVIICDTEVRAAGIANSMLLPADLVHRAMIPAIEPITGTVEMFNKMYGAHRNTMACFERLYGDMPEPVGLPPVSSGKDSWWERRAEDRHMGASPSSKAREAARKRRKR